MSLSGHTFFSDALPCPEKETSLLQQGSRHHRARYCNGSNGKSVLPWWVLDTTDVLMRLKKTKAGWGVLDHQALPVSAAYVPRVTSLDPDPTS